MSFAVERECVLPNICRLWVGLVEFGGQGDCTLLCLFCFVLFFLVDLLGEIMTLDTDWYLFRILWIVSRCVITL